MLRTLWGSFPKCSHLVCGPIVRTARSQGMPARLPHTRTPAPHRGVGGPHASPPHALGGTSRRGECLPRGSHPPRRAAHSEGGTHKGIYPLFSVILSQVLFPSSLPFRQMGMRGKIQQHLLVVKEICSKITKLRLHLWGWLLPPSLHREAMGICRTKPAKASLNQLPGAS